MGEYNATEQELKNALLSVRWTDWEYLSARLDSKADVFYGRGDYSFSCFMEFKASDNYSEMLDAELRTVQEWRELCFEDMIVELNSASMNCRKRFEWLVERYSTGLKKKLLDNVYDKTKHGKHLHGVDGEKEREYWQKRYCYLEGVKEFTPEDKSERDDIAKWDGLFLANENGVTHYSFTENDLIQKILVFQELLKRIPGATAEQPKEPAVIDGAADRQLIGWRGTPEQLGQLADQLQEQGHIESSQWFVERFDSDCPPDVDGWSGVANHIVYLLEQLQERKLFVHVPQSRLERVFRIKGYKSKKDGYGRNNAEKPKKADEIDRILSSVFADS